MMDLPYSMNLDDLVAEVTAPAQIAIPVDILKFLALAEAFTFTGSQVIGGAGPESDIDIVVLVPSFGCYVELMQLGFDVGGSQAPSSADTFFTMRRGSINIIMVDNGDYYDAWCEATVFAITEKVSTKEERVALFRSVWKQKGLIE